MCRFHSGQRTSWPASQSASLNVPSLDQLLLDLAKGRISLDVATGQLSGLIEQQPKQVRQITARVQMEIAAGRLAHDSGRALLNAIQQADGKTAVLRNEPRPMVEPTLVRPENAAEATAVQAPDNTQQMADVQGNSAETTQVKPSATAAHDEATHYRGSAAASDVTQRAIPPKPTGDSDSTIATSGDTTSDETALRPNPRTDADVTVGASTIAQSPKSTGRAKSQGAVPTDDDATIRTVRDPAAFPSTSARTVQLPTAGASAYAKTLKTPEQTEAALGLPEHSSDTTQGQQGPLEPGSVIKQRFLLETMIGKGGMGLVFGAIDRRKEEAKDPNPRVALKVLNADFQRHPQSFMALQREARKAQSLAHPNVVTVFDFDRDGETVYMTMELLKGRSLDSIVREVRGKGIGREIALPIIRGIAEGLAYAHRKGIVHSDLKPGNVFVIGDGTPKILDFGIARAVPNANAEEGQDVFDAGSLGAYTEAYATDEMVDGIDPHPADDLYALGIIGYELLTGFHPYQRHSAPNARKLGLKLPPLKGLKRREAQALERCLSFERKDRPKDANEFLKLFRGVTALQQATLAATAVLALVSGYLWYQNYRETTPAVPFSELPVQTQQEITGLMQEGEELWGFYQREDNPYTLQQSIEMYAHAYALHPRNRDAVKGLRRGADALLKLARDETERHQAAERLQQVSAYYRNYDPVVDAAR